MDVLVGVDEDARDRRSLRTVATANEVVGELESDHLRAGALYLIAAVALGGVSLFYRAGWFD